MLRMVAGVVGGGVALVAALRLLDPAPAALDCSGGGRMCPRVEIESPAEKLRQTAAHPLFSRHGTVPKGAARKAVEAKAAMQSRKADVSGANGLWREYGRGGLLSSGLVQTIGAADVPDTDLHLYAGRIDNFSYDEANQRLFAAVGTGGIWMSQAVSNDVRTIGDLWVSVGDRLPTQANGAVIWTPAGGGTLISLSGDSVMSTGSYPGLGAHWSTDLGTTWNHAEGFPDDVQVFNAELDRGNPSILYVASSRGLFRSADAGRSFVNVRLPTTAECAGVEDPSTPCLFANVVSDVVVMAPGGVTNFECNHSGCPVLAAVGWRAGRMPFPNSEIPQSPANGLYKSPTGEAGTFVRLEPPATDPATEQGFAPAERIGRIEMGAAWGPDQDHGYVYALVQDSEVLNGGDITLDPPLDAIGAFPLATLINGFYVSPDFGDTWIRMAAAEEIATIPGPFTALIPPGAQSWYNQWVMPDPTRTLPGLGIPTRLVFGLEEIFQNIGSAAGVPLNGTAQAGPQDFENIGRYFSATGLDQTTHPDQHAGILIPTGIDGGVCLFAGNDGGVARQCALPGQPFTNQGWGRGANEGFFTLLPYGLGVAKDGTVWFGLQDNGSGHIEPDTGLHYGDFGADGFFAEVDPDNSSLAYTESQNGGLVRTDDRGATSTSIAPAYSRVNFSNWFSMDPLDGKHMITTANEIYETLDAPNVTSGTWNRVFRLGSNKDKDVLYTAAVADVHGDAIYAGFCGDCGVTVNDAGFENGIATNIGGDEPPVRGTENGWHKASARGLPSRFISAVEIDPDDPRTVYVGLSGYMSSLRGPGHFGDPNDGADVAAGNIFKSTDAGETFTAINGDLADMPVTSILARNGQLLIGTDFGAFISTDENGSSWAPLGNGMPNVPVTMLKLQPGNPNHLFASTFGRGIWHYEFTGESAMKPGSVVTQSAFGSGAWGGLALAGLLGLALLRRRRS